MAADLANSVMQTGIMFAELAESQEANRIAHESNRIAREANQISYDQMQQDYRLTMMQMKQERDLDEADEKLRRELNANLLTELRAITNSINGVSIAIREQQYQNEIDNTELFALPILRNWLGGNNYERYKIDMI